MSNSEQRLIDAALARLPEWQPPPGFAARVAVRAASERPVNRLEMLPLVLRGSAVAACVSVGAWLGGELLAGLLSPESGTGESLAWLLATGVLVLAWRLGRRVGRRRQELAA
jgi:hypothetical protein